MTQLLSKIFILICISVKLSMTSSGRPLNFTSEIYELHEKKSLQLYGILPATFLSNDQHDLYSVLKTLDAQTKMLITHSSFETTYVPTLKKLFIDYHKNTAQAYALLQQMNIDNFVDGNDINLNCAYLLHKECFDKISEQVDQLG